MLAGIKTVTLPQCKNKEEYPPRGHDIYETAEIWKIWKEHRAATLYPDRRGGKTWKPLLELDPEKLQYTVKAGESVIIRDKKKGDIVGMVIRNFSNGNESLLDWINGIILENTGLRRNVRVCFIPNLCLWRYPQLLLVRGPWPLMPDRLYFWCTQ